MTENSSDKSSKTSINTIKALAFEIGIILFLTTLVLAVLNYLKFIDVGALIAQPVNVSVSKIAQIPAKTLLTPSPAAQNVQINPALPKLGLIAQNKALHFAQSISEFEGKIATVDATPGFDKDLNASYQIRMVVDIGTSSATTVLVYPKEALSKIKILDAKKSVLTFSDLKPGNLVTIKTNLGMLRQYPNNFNEVVITKK